MIEKTTRGCPSTLPPQYTLGAGSQIAVNQYLSPLPYRPRAPLPLTTFAVHRGTKMVHQSCTHWPPGWPQQRWQTAGALLQRGSRRFGRTPAITGVINSALRLTLVHDGDPAMALLPQTCSSSRVFSSSARCPFWSLALRVSSTFPLTALGMWSTYCGLMTGCRGQRRG